MIIVQVGDILRASSYLTSSIKEFKEFNCNQLIGTGSLNGVTVLVAIIAAQRCLWSEGKQAIFFFH